MRATARASANIAVVKYWGKRDEALNLPAAGSLSVTLAALETRTTVSFDDPALSRDLFTLDGRPAQGGALERVAQFLDRVRALSGLDRRARVESTNAFPTASGLSSSSSGFAALALAATRAAGLDLPAGDLSALARRGSASAARSIFGGFVELPPEGVARPLLAPDLWPLPHLVVVVEEDQKLVSSREGMIRTARTSPYYAAWLEQVARDLEEARGAIERRDLEALGLLAERNALRMHAAALGSDPPLLYLGPGSIRVLRRVWELRREGLQGYCTLDAGPQVVVLASPSDAAPLEKALRAVEGVRSVLRTLPGSGATLVA